MTIPLCVDECNHYFFCVGNNIGFGTLECKNKINLNRVIARAVTYRALIKHKILTKDLDYLDRLICEAFLKLVLKLGEVVLCRIMLGGKWKQ